MSLDFGWKRQYHENVGKLCYFPTRSGVKGNQEGEGRNKRKTDLHFVDELLLLTGLLSNQIVIIKTMIDE